jgi:hypothetical protein
MTTILVILAIAAAAAGIWYFSRKQKAWDVDAAIWRALSGFGIPKSKAMFAYTYTTPQGVAVRSTVAVPGSALQSIDDGINNQIIRHNAAYPKWDKGKTFPEYRLLFVDPMAFNEFTDPGSPALLVNGVQTAGTVLGMIEGNLSPVKEPYIVLPHQQDSQWSHVDYLMHSAWNEGEHFREWLNRDNEPVGKWKEYEGPNDVHPHVA